MYGSHSCTSHVPVLRYSYCTRFESLLSLYQATLLPICTVATAAQAMCQYCGTVIVRDSNPHCHCISPHCYQYVRYPQLHKRCASIAVQLLCWIRTLATKFVITRAAFIFWVPFRVESLRYSLQGYRPESNRTAGEGRVFMLVPCQNKKSYLSNIYSSYTGLSLKMRPTCCPETLVTNYHRRPHNIPEERRVKILI
jgi:hypothetical protein